MIFSFWNIRGLNNPHKHREVFDFTRKNKIDIIAFLETKLSDGNFQLLSNLVFGGWHFANNFDLHPNGRILIFWNPASVCLDSFDIHDQVINCLATSLGNGSHVAISFVYGFNGLVDRRSMWSHLEQFGASCHLSWVVGGDFNSVLAVDERINGRPVSAYDLRDPLDFCMRNSLTELTFSGCKFTWSNGSLKSRLDHVLVNDIWLDTFSSSAAHFPVSGTISDHSPGIIYTENFDERPNVNFKFVNIWTKHPDFLTLVDSTWQASLYGKKMYVVCRKMKMLKQPLKRLNNRDFAHISERTKRALECLQVLQTRFQTEHDNDELLTSLNEQRELTIRLSKWERSYYLQMAKGISLRLKDRNTKFFYSWAKRCRLRSRILSVERNDGSFAIKRSEVAQEFLVFYKDLLGLKEPTLEIKQDILGLGPLLDQVSAEHLIRPITADEIKQAIFSINKDKSPGPDGYTSQFFIKSWDIVGAEVTEAILEFFESGLLLKQLNHSIIALIPKVNCPRKVGDFRPISLCNVLYKAISKILANRLSLVMSLLVDEAQAGFVKGRMMTENILLAQELIRNYGRKNASPMCLIKVDIKKAFDSISWNFLESILKGLNFPSNFIGWVLQCVTTTSFSLSINGSLEGYFRGERGLRQGDPISPLLFVLGMEYLSRMLRRLHSFPDFKFHAKCGIHSISHLVFADDLLLFARGDRNSVGVLLGILEEFGETSGLRCNIAKSEVFLAGISNEEKNHIREMSGFRFGQMPFKYLGVPIAGLSLQLVHFGDYIKRLTDYTSLWNIKSLSYAGRIELIRGVIQGVHAFWMGVLPIPYGVQKIIGRIARNFLWGVQGVQKKKMWVSWVDVCRPKKEGGLGLFDLIAWNKALLFKHLWNIQSKKDSLWVRWMHHYYGLQNGVWDFQSKPSFSVFFKKLLLIRDGIVLHFGNVSSSLSELSRLNSCNSSLSRCVYGIFRNKGLPLSGHSTIWASTSIPKHCFIFWLAARDRLPTRDNLHFVLTDLSCPTCGALRETRDHLLFLCPFAMQVWDGILSWIGISRSFFSLNSLLRWAGKHSRRKSGRSKFIKATFAATIYFIWNARNHRVFENRILNAQDVVHRIATQVYRLMYDFT